MSSSSSLPSTYKAATIVAPKQWALVDKPMPEVKGEQVLIKVEACGVCHSDVFTVEGLFPGLQFPRVPGHEVIGVVVKVGERASRLKLGQRVGRGWHGEQCFQCDSCRAGDFITCANAKVCGINDDGGYAEYMVAPEHSLSLVPEGMDAVAAASLMCAGVTVFNGLRRQHKMPPSTVVVQGVGGLGHLAIQFARNMGYYVIAVNRGSTKEAESLKLGAHIYINSEEKNAVEEIKKLGGADIVLPSAGAEGASEYVNCLKKRGVLLAVGVDFHNFKVSPLQLIGNSTSVIGHASGTAFDSEETMKFAKLFNVAAQTEVFPFLKFEEAYAHTMASKARYRAVLKF